MNNADVTAISTGLKKFYSEIWKKQGHPEPDSLTIEIACPNGVDKGAGGDGEITVGDDYVSDSKPLPAAGHPAAPRSRHTKAAALSTFAPSMAVLVGVVANLLFL